MKHTHCVSSTVLARLALLEHVILIVVASQKDSVRSAKVLKKRFISILSIELVDIRITLDDFIVLESHKTARERTRWIRLQWTTIRATYTRTLKSSITHAMEPKSAGHVCGLPTATRAVLLIANGYRSVFSCTATSSSNLTPNSKVGSTWRNKNKMMLQKSFLDGPFRSFGESTWSYWRSLRNSISA